MGACLPEGSRIVRTDGPVDLARTLAPIRRGATDPCMRLWPGECWRATRTPEGPVTVHLRQVGSADVRVDAWGPGTAWALEHAPGLVGAGDDTSDFEPRLPWVRDLARRFAGIRIGRTSAVAEALAPTVLEQKVTGGAARRSWARLVRQFGEPAPGPAGLYLPPAPSVLATTPSWVFHRMNVERKRADTVVRAMARAARLEETCTMAIADAYRRLQAFPGIGPWSAAEVAHVALGDADAVSVGDYHLKHQVSWAFTREPRGTDERMLELLEPWRGHRARIVRLLGAAGIHAPRFGPRLAHQAIAAY